MKQIQKLPYFYIALIYGYGYYKIIPRFELKVCNELKNSILEH